MNDDGQNSFQRDSEARSFRMTGFRWKDIPVLLVSLLLVLCLLTGYNLVADSAIASLTPGTRKLALGLLLGLCLGYMAGVSIGGRREREEAGPPAPLSSIWISTP